MEDSGHKHKEFEVEQGRRIDDFNAELSGTTTRRERFGVGENSKAARIEGEKRSKSSNSFYAAASAQAYAQTVSFSFGDQDVSMTLGDLRSVAQDRYNTYLTRALSEGATAQDRERRDAYEGLLSLIDDVAAGKAPSSSIDEYVKENGLAGEIVEAAQEMAAVEVNIDEPQRASDYTKQTASARNADFVGAMFGNS